MKKILCMALLFSSSVSYCWEHMDNFPKEYFLVAAAVNKHEIKYCLESPDSGQEMSAKEESYHMQIMAAIKVWLTSINQQGVYNSYGNKINLDTVKITPVKPKGSCADEDTRDKVDIIVYISNGETSKSVFSYMEKFYSVLSGSNNYNASYIDPERINKISVILNSSEITKEVALLLKKIKTSVIVIRDYKLIDFNSYLKQGESFITAVTKIYNNPKIFFQERGLKEPKEMNTYQALLHEFGHAFGLGDQYQYNDTNRPTPKAFSTRYQRQSIMRADYLYKPSCDDITGGLFLFDRYTHHPRIMSSICKEEQGVYINSKKNGRWIEVKDSGEIIAKTYNNEGLAQGEAASLSYDEDKNKLIGHFNYDKGFLEGEMKDYYENGTLATEVNFSHDEPIGEAKFYNTSGEIIVVIETINKKQDEMLSEIKNTAPAIEDDLSNLKSCNLLIKTTEYYNYKNNSVKSRFYTSANDDEQESIYNITYNADGSTHSEYKNYGDTQTYTIFNKKKEETAKYEIYKQLIVSLDYKDYSFPKKTGNELTEQDRKNIEAFFKDFLLEPQTKK